MSPRAGRARRTSLRLPLVLLLAALPLVGCSAGGGNAGRERSDAAEPAVDRIPTVLATDRLRLPLERYLAGPEQVRRVDQGRLRLIDTCMRRFGYRYPLTLPALHAPPGVLDRRYGITDAATAARHGYGVSGPAEQQRPAEPTLGPAARTVMFGRGRSVIGGARVPTGGCLGEAGAVLSSSAPGGADPGLGQQLLLRSFAMSQQDSRVRRVFGAWSACMATHGYRYTDPLQPMGDPFLGGGTGTEARRIAGLDVACKQRTNLVGVWYAVESAYQDRLIAENSAALGRSKAALDAQLRTAATAP